MEQKFNVILSWDEEAQIYVVTVPVLPRCVTQGKGQGGSFGAGGRGYSSHTGGGMFATDQPLPQRTRVQNDIDVQWTFDNAHQSQRVLADY